VFSPELLGSAPGYLIGARLGVIGAGLPGIEPIKETGVRLGSPAGTYGMQQIGTVATYQDARRLGIYFRAHGSATRLEERPDGWAISVCNEDHAPWAKKELEAFTQDPDDSRFPPPLSAPEYLLGRLPPLERQIVEMHHQGYTIGQIAGNLNVYERKVRRVLDRFVERCRRLREGGA
jgi:hypothetical protein